MAKVAVVTGANQGIGYWLVHRMCKEHPDWIVYGTSRSAENGEEAMLKLKEEGLTARYLELDITKPETIRALRDYIAMEHGGIDILVNNAGFTYKRGSPEPPVVKTNVVMPINFFGTQMVCEMLFPLLNDSARVAILSSTLAFYGLRNMETLSPNRYKAYTKENPPMNVETITQSMTDFVESVNEGDYQIKGWARDEASFACKDRTDDTAYQISKLGCTLLARAYQHEFNTTEPERDIVVNAVDPGYVATGMTQYRGWLTVEQGADNVYYSTTLPPYTEIRGKHLADKKIKIWK